ncbi:amidase [Xanthomonas axonopodis]|uniref:amidase n=1 Tax=Xanthomonas axonopodis TaxID=53413 RepID=UPI00355750CE
MTDVISPMDMTSPLPSDLPYASAAELSMLYAQRVVSPVDVAREVLNVVDRLNPVVNAYCHLDRSLTLRMAADSEARWMNGAQLGPADGVPYGIKDNLYVRGLPTGFGSRALEQLSSSEFDSPAQARLIEAGGVLIGKTTTSELAWKGTADNPRTGVTRNIWNTELTTGGSSGGAACATAAGMGTFHVGTDGGGSTRIPASFCGVVGMKATFGLVAAWPAGPMLTLSNVGPIVRTVSDLKVLSKIIMQPDARDWNYVPLPRLIRSSVKSLHGLRIGLHLDDACEPCVRQAVLNAAEELKSQGAEIVAAQLPLQGAKEIIKKLWEAGTAWLIANIPVEKRELMDAGLRASGQRGDMSTLPEYYKAMVDRQAFGEAMLRYFKQFDLVITPTLPIDPFAAGRDAPADAPSQDWLDWNPYTYPFNLTRQPAISLPVGVSEKGMPIGLQLVAGLYQDEWLMDVAELVEAAVRAERRRPRGPSQ